ncbi:hypothetical protein DL96DRAFT_1703983 [Flagelloscypha sp. PMI_526]|nr:hypothetical protein DL96DRAFT_1703983 [Flagelloscypha sp. PMI_526]
MSLALAGELIDEILSYYEEDVLFLRTACLISRAWVYPCQTRLFGKITLSPRPPRINVLSDRLLRLANSPTDSSEIISFVTSLHIEDGSSRRDAPRWERIWVNDSKSLPKLLLCLPSLTTLHLKEKEINLQRWDTFSDAFKEGLKSVLAWGLEELHLNLSLTFRTSTDFFQVLYNAKSLRLLALCRVTIDIWHPPNVIAECFTVKHRHSLSVLYLTDMNHDLISHLLDVLFDGRCSLAVNELQSFKLDCPEFHKLDGSVIERVLNAQISKTKLEKIELSQANSINKMLHRWPNLNLSHFTHLRSVTLMGVPFHILPNQITKHFTLPNPQLKHNTSWDEQTPHQLQSLQLGIYPLTPPSTYLDLNLTPESLEEWKQLDFILAKEGSYPKLRLMKVVVLQPLEDVVPIVLDCFPSLSKKEEVRVYVDVEFTYH